MNALPAHGRTIPSPHEVPGSLDDVSQAVGLWVSALLQDGLLESIEVSRQDKRVAFVPGQSPEGSLGESEITGRILASIQTNVSVHGGGPYECAATFVADRRYPPNSGPHDVRVFVFEGAQTPAQALDRQVGNAVMVQQLIHTERLNELLIKQLALTNEVSGEVRRKNDAELTRAYKRISDLEEREQNVRKMMLDYQDAKRKEDLELAKIKREDRVHQLAFDTLNLVAPAVASRLLPAGSGTPPKETDSLAEFFNDLSPKQIARIQGEVGWDPGQLTVVATLADAYRQGKTPSFGHEQVQRLLATMTPEQMDRIEAILRKDQLKLLERVFRAYFQAPEPSGGTP